MLLAERRPSGKRSAVENVRYLGAVLAAWDAIHTPIRKLIAAGSDGLHEALVDNLKHLRFHIGIIEMLLGEWSERTEGAS